MGDTRVTRLRNLMTPVVNYFAMTKDPNIELLEDLIKKEHDKVQKMLPEIVDIIKSIPDDACENND